MITFHLCNGNSAEWFRRWVAAIHAKHYEYDDAGFHRSSETCEEVRGFDEEAWSDGEEYCLHVPSNTATFVSFVLCRWDTHALFPIPKSLTATTDYIYDKEYSVESTLQTCLDKWGMPYEDVEEVRFHHHDEGCTFARPFSGPIIDRVYDGVPLKLHLHLHFKSALERRVICRRALKTAMVNCSLEFRLDFNENTTSALHKMKLRLRACIALEDLPEMIRAETGEFLSEFATKKRGRKLLDLRSGFCYPYWTRIRCSSFENAWLGLEGRRLAVDTLSDLFPDPHSDENMLEIAVMIQKEYFKPAYKSWAEATFPHKPTGGTLVRLRATDLSHRKPPCEHAIRHLVTVLQYATFNDNIMVLEVPSFDFGDFSIHQGSQAFSEGIHGVLNRTQDEVLKMFKSNLLKSPRVGSGIPIRPIYTFNTFDPVEFGLGMEKLPACGITLAIHFVENLSSVDDGTISSDDSSDEDLDEPKETPVDLPLDYVLIIDKAEQLDNLAGFILNNFLKACFASEPDAAERRRIGPVKLFSKPLIGKWKTALWVMPHEPGEMKLYHMISDGKQKGKRPLLSFLNPRLVAQEDTRMYMEVHFLRKESSNFNIWPEAAGNGEIDANDEEEMADFGELIEEYWTRREVAKMKEAGERYKQDQLQAKIKQLEDNESAMIKQKKDQLQANIKQLEDNKAAMRKQLENKSKEIRKIEAAGERYKQDQLQAKIRELEDTKLATTQQLGRERLGKN